MADNMVLVHWVLIDVIDLNIIQIWEDMKQQFNLCFKLHFI